MSRSVTDSLWEFMKTSARVCMYRVPSVGLRHAVLPTT